MIVWGGRGITMPSTGGGRYDPGTDSWTATSMINAPPGRRFLTAVWTGAQRNDRLGRGRLWWPFKHRRKILRRCTESDTHANTFSDPNRDSYGDSNCNANGDTTSDQRPRSHTYAAAAPDAGTSTLEVRK